jgi:hypothetical protein
MRLTLTEARQQLLPSPEALQPRVTTRKLKLLNKEREPIGERDLLRSMRRVHALCRSYIRHKKIRIDGKVWWFISYSGEEAVR